MTFYFLLFLFLLSLFNRHWNTMLVMLHPVMQNMLMCYPCYHHIPATCNHSLAYVYVYIYIFQKLPLLV